MNGPSVHIVSPEDPEIDRAADEPETKDDEGDGHLQPHFSQLEDTESLAKTDARSKSWPPAPRGPALSNLQKRVESFQRRLNRLRTEREQALLKHMELKFVRESYRQQHKFVDESQQLFSQHVEHMISTNDFNTTREELFSRYGKARGDYRDLQVQSGQLQALEDSLYSLEDSIRQHEQNLARTSQKLLGWLRHLNPESRDHGEDRDMTTTAGDPTEQISTDQDTEPTSKASSEGDPFLEHYFDSAGDVKVFRRRLNEVLKDHEEQRVLRTHLEDQGNDMLLPEIEFEKNCEIERKAAEIAVQEAIDKKNLAHAECLRHGINPDHHKTANSDTLDVALEQTLFTNDSAMHQSSLDFGLTDQDVDETPMMFSSAGPSGDIIVPSDNETADSSRVANSVERWIKTVEAPRIPPSLNDINPEVANPKERSPPNRGAKSPRFYHVTERDKEYLLRHGGTDIFQRLGLDLPLSYKKEMDAKSRDATSANMSDHSRSSSESRISVLLKENLSQEELKAHLLDVRGRQRLR